MLHVKRKILVGMERMDGRGWFRDFKHDVYFPISALSSEGGSVNACLSLRGKGLKAFGEDGNGGLVKGVSIVLRE